MLFFMRMRKKPWARPELDVCPYFIKNPVAFGGCWQQSFKNPQAELIIELGCGKGYFLAEYGSDNPQQNFIGIDISSDVLAVARRQIQASYSAKNLPIDNVKLFSYEIELISEVFTPQDLVSAIYINFCNPWPKPPHHKKRLTHTKQIIRYLNFLKDGGKIFFKTDDDELFEHSLGYFEECGLEILELCRDLPLTKENEKYATEHELMFRAQNKPIKYCVLINNKAATTAKTQAIVKANPKYICGRPEKFIKQ